MHTPSATPAPLRTAWLVVLLLLPVALLNYLDRQMLAAMKYSVMADVPTIGSDANWGLMLGQFKWVYAFLSPVGGYVADRFSRRGTICGSLFVWSAVTWATGRVTTYHDLLWVRSLMGISEAFYWWGVIPHTVSAWRKRLGVGRRTVGTSRLHQRESRWN